MAKKGPVIRLITWLKDNNRLKDEELSNIETEIKDEIQEAITFAEQGTWEPIADLTKDVYSPPSSSDNTSVVTNLSQGEQT